MSGDEQHEFTVTGSTVRYEGAIVALRVDEVVMPGGHTARREVVEHRGAVAVVALDDQDRVALIEQYRQPLGRRLWELPAGLLDAEGEEPVDAAERELAEEVDLAADRWEVLLDLALSPGFTDEALRVYLARGLSPAARPDGFVVEHEEADMEVCLVPLDDLVTAIYAGRVQNPTMVVGGLAAYAALRTRRVEELRRPGAPWPARAAKAERDAVLASFLGLPRAGHDHA